MKKGYKVIDMDTHVGPSFDVLCEYVDPGFRPRLQEMEPYRQRGGKNIAVAPYQWTRYAGRKPHEKPAILCPCEHFEGPELTKACKEGGQP
jgi:hypothetical protein